MLQIERLELIEVGSSEPFKVYFKDEEFHETILWSLCTSGYIELINEDGGYNRYTVELRTARELESGCWASILQVRKVQRINT